MEGTVEITNLETDTIPKALKKDFLDAINHGILVSNLAVMIAKKLEMEKEFIEQLAIAGMLHDIGKLKLGKYLNEKRSDALKIEKINYVRMHAQFSYNILKKQSFNEFILTTVYHHHENYDGTGYPDNLVGTAIPLSARIIRCSDVFAALVSKRTYRDAFDMDTAVEMMIDEIKDFDMKVFLAFLEVVHSSEFEHIRHLVNLCNKTT